MSDILKKIDKYLLKRGMLFESSKGLVAGLEHLGIKYGYGLYGSKSKAESGGDEFITVRKDNNALDARTLESMKNLAKDSGYTFIRTVLGIRFKKINQ